jgi:chaperonin GroEL (HSP60 family)
MVVKDVVEKPSIVAGGGSPEAYLATELNEWAGSSEGREQLAIKQYAEALESIPITIAENAGMDPIDTLITLRANQSNGKQTVGVNAREAKIGNMFALDIVEPLAVKEQIIKSATEAACMIIRIDDVIAVSGGPGAGGPPSGMPPMG